MSHVMTPVPPVGISATCRAVEAAAAHVASAARFLVEWSARQTDSAAGRSYVAAGHDCIDSIDGALRVLYEARVALTDEIRRDESKRAARVDELLARIAADRNGRAEGRKR